MEQLVVLVRERVWEDESWSDYYIVEGSSNPEENFRAAIQEFLETLEGIRQIQLSSEDYNWGDAVNTVPSSIWAKHGIREVSEGENITFQKPFEIFVEQDEVLIPNSYYEREI